MQKAGFLMMWVNSSCSQLHNLYEPYLETTCLLAFAKKKGADELLICVGL